MQLYLVAVALLILAADMLFGLGRGFGKSVVRFVTQVASAVVAFFAAKALAKAFSDVGKDYLIHFLQSNETVKTFFADNPDALDSVCLLAAGLIAPMLFFALYLVIKLLSLIIYAVVCKVFHIGAKEEDENGKKYRPTSSRLLGLCIGALAGIVGITIFTIPVVGYLDFASDVMTEMSEAGISESEETAAVNEQVLTPVKTAPVVSLLFGTVGEPVFDGLTTTKYGNDRVVLKNEAAALLRTVGDAKTLSGKEISTYGEGEANTLRLIAAEMGNSVILRHVGSSALRDLATKWLAGEAFLGIKRPQVNENANIVLTGCLQMLSTSDADNIRTDLESFADVFMVLIKYDVFSGISGGTESEDFLQQLNSNGFLDEMAAVIRSAPRMKPIYNAITNVGMRYMIAELGAPEEYIEKYPELMNNMSDAVRSLYNEEGNVDKEEFTKNISEILADQNVTVNDTAVDLIADGIAENFTKEEVESMSNEEIITALVDRFGSADEALELAKKYQESLQSGDGENLPDVDLSKLPGYKGGDSSGNENP